MGREFGLLRNTCKMHELVPVQSQNTQSDSGPGLLPGTTKDLFPHRAVTTNQRWLGPLCRA